LRQVSVDGRLICIACTEQGEVYAIDDRCSHEQTSLSGGDLIGTEVECPAHGSRFHVLTGEVTGAPADQPLATFPVVVDGDDVLVEL
jgi:nitrite reductase/ring-hydroxylating ferredoxin subunit